MHDATSSERIIRPDVWYPTRDVAAALRVSQRAIQRAHRRGALRAAEVNGRGDLRFLGSWVLAWLEDCARRQAEAS